MYLCINSSTVKVYHPLDELLEYVSKVWLSNNQILDIKDIQEELQKVQNKIDTHLQIQDDKIDEILKYTKENSGE